MCVWQNYPDVVDEPVKTISPWFAVYFTVFSFVGMFLLLSLLVAYFQVRICSCPRPLCLWFALRVRNAVAAMRRNTTSPSTMPRAQ